MIEPRLKPWQQEGRIPEPSKREQDCLRAELFTEQDGICYICKKGMSRELRRSNTAVIEHVQPGKMGGCKDWNRSNLRAACWSCNADKGSKRPCSWCAHVHDGGPENCYE